jgi:dipeptidyl aminopeptidase/acylaminoacyl peptidase
LLRDKPENSLRKVARLAAKIGALVCNVSLPVFSPQGELPMSASARRSLATVAATLAAAVFLGLAHPSPAAAAAAKRAIAETDLFQFVWTADPQISPDGRRVVYVRVTVNAKKDGYDTALWIVPADGSEPPRPFTSGPADSRPRWSPDSSRLAFVRAVEKDGKRQPGQIYLISTQGGEAAALTDLPKGATAPEWSPDGRTIAFASSTSPKDLAKRAAKDAKEAKEKAKDDKDAKDGKKPAEPQDPQEPHESDVRVITRAVYRFNDAGYLDPTRINHLWTLRVPTGGSTVLPEPKRLTVVAEGKPDDLVEGGALWSPDGSVVYFDANPDKEPYYSQAHREIYAVPAAGGAARRVLSFDGEMRDPVLSPDGKRIAFSGYANPAKDRSYNQPNLYVADVTGPPGSPEIGTPRNLTAQLDADVLASVGSDQHPPRAAENPPIVWSGDGRSLVVEVNQRGRGNLWRIDAASGKAEPLTQGDQEVVAYSATPDGAHFAVLISTPTVLGDLSALDAGAVASRRLTPLAHPNQELFSQLELTSPEEITYKSFDGREIHAFVQKPADFVAGKKYPLILNIHGGPHSAYGTTFFHEMQWMAAKGYVVLYPNPRGSSSYGEEFGNVIQYEFPGDDAKDLLAGVDEMVRRGIADPKKLGVTGGSGGGILTNWIVTQTDRFAAAAAQRSIADWSAFFYTADFTLYRPSWFHGAPWEDPQDFARRSPITYAAKITTPLMLIEGEADYRTPPAAGGEQMFRALKYQKKPTVMIRFPGESHELSRSGQPWHRVERLRHIVAWMDKYLQGKKVDAYDVR